MPPCFFISDLHGHIDRYQKLLAAIIQEIPAGVFIGGDLLPSGPVCSEDIGYPLNDFIKDFLVPKFHVLKITLSESYPRIFLILGNDDVRGAEVEIFEGVSQGLWEYVHGKMTRFGIYDVFGYAYVPPTPFLLKDWERYDISRYVDPGCIAPEEGWLSQNLPENEIKYGTIQDDLRRLTEEEELSKSIFLFHSPPYHTNLDHTDLEGKMIDHVPVDFHVGSIAIRQLIEERQPLLTLHGHIHESPRITGSWKDQIGQTYCFSASHDGPELSLVRFDPDNLENASRELI